MSKITKEQFVRGVAFRHRKSQRETGEWLNIVLKEIGEQLAAGNHLQLPGFGTFKVSERKGGRGKNLRTGEVVEYAGYKLPSFTAGALLKARVQSKGAKSRRGK